MIGLLIVTQVGGIMATKSFNYRGNKVPVPSAQPTAWYSKRSFFLKMTPDRQKQYISLEAAAERTENAFLNAFNNTPAGKAYNNAESKWNASPAAIEYQEAWKAYQLAWNASPAAIEYKEAWKAYQLALKKFSEKNNLPELQNNYQLAWDTLLKTTEGEEYREAGKALENFLFPKNKTNTMDKKTATPTTQEKMLHKVSERIQ